jgi:WD40-like Beta Propeller Repeat
MSVAFGRRLSRGAALSALLAALGLAPGARGDVFGATALLSAGPFGQAEYAHDTDLSEDGRFVVFDGSVAGAIGVWRRETRPGATLEQVAGGNATLPSVSADGRYVSFTTNEGANLPALTDGQVHAGEQPQEAPGVYVRDMSKAPGEPGAFTLASAKDHSAQSLTYEFPGATPEEVAQKTTEYGATAAGRSAITADGRTVAFVTTAASDLAGPQTPPLQVAVRHLDTQETQLVSTRFDPATGEAAVNPETGASEPVSENEFGFGAVWSPGTPPAFDGKGRGVERGVKTPQLAGASISADGSAVAWLGQQIAEQVRTLGGEDGEALGLAYSEPLWKRISEGPLAPTVRVTGGAEAESPACREQPEPTLPPHPSPQDPCQGPFATQLTGGTGTWNAKSLSNTTPELSRNGDDVAFIGTAPLVGQEGGFGISNGEFNSDAYWEDMTAPTRSSGLRRLTEFASGDKQKLATNASIEEIGISPDGGQVAFTTQRTVFPLGTPAFVSAPAAVPGLAELFDVDLANNTLTRVTRGYEGGTPEHPEVESEKEDRYAHLVDGSMSPSFSADGNAIAFSSTAANLVFGDGNNPPIGSLVEYDDGADAFLVPRVTFEPEPTPQTISAPPPNPALASPWRFTVSASSLASGAVQLRATVPGSGTLAASAVSALPAGAARRGVHKVRRTVASATGRSRASAVLRLQLTLPSRYAKLANRAGGLPGTVAATFSAPGHATLRRTLAVRFVRRSHASRKGNR